MDTNMRAKINVAIVKKETGHLVLKVYNGYGDPEIPFVTDAVQLDDSVSDPDHIFGLDCRCAPTVEGNVIKHR